MNKTQFNDFRREVLKPPVVVPAGGGGGQGWINPDRSTTNIASPQQYQTMQINLLPYPSTTGLDSAGHYQAFLFNSNINPSATKSEVRVAQGNQPYKTGDTVVGFSIGVTNKCPSPADNGFYLFQPISVSSGQFYYGGMWIEEGVGWTPATSGGASETINFSYSDDFTNGFQYLDYTKTPIVGTGSPVYYLNPVYMKALQTCKCLITAALYWYPTTINYSTYLPTPQNATGGQYETNILSVGTSSTDEYECGPTALIGYNLEPVINNPINVVGSYANMTSSAWQAEAISAWQHGSYIFGVNAGDLIQMATSNSGNYITQSKVLFGYITVLGF